MKTNTVLNVNPKVRMDVRTAAERAIAWFKYPEMGEMSLEAWKKHQVAEDLHTAKLMLVGTVVVHVIFAVWAGIIVNH